MSARGWSVGFLASLGLAVVGCGPIFQKSRDAVEQVNAQIPGGQFHVIATIAGGASRTDIRMSVNVRTVLQDSGFTIVRRAGRWESETDALRAICEPGAAVDGVLVIWYDRLLLRDCRTERTAYEINGGNTEGITRMTGRLIRYLRQESGAPPPKS